MNFLAVAKAAAYRGEPASVTMRIADPLIALAVDLAAAVLLTGHEQDMRELAAMKAAALMWGVKPDADGNVWEESEEFETYG